MTQAKLLSSLVTSQRRLFIEENAETKTTSVCLNSQFLFSYLISLSPTKLTLPQSATEWPFLLQIRRFYSHALPRLTNQMQAFSDSRPAPTETSEVVTDVVLYCIKQASIWSFCSVVVFLLKSTISQLYSSAIKWVNSLYILNNRCEGYCDKLSTYHWKTSLCLSWQQTLPQCLPSGETE